MSLRQLNSRNNGLVLMLKTVLWYLNCFLFSVAMDEKDGNGLKLVKIGLLFSSSDAMFSKLTQKLFVASSP